MTAVAEVAKLDPQVGVVSIDPQTLSVTHLDTLDLCEHLRRLDQLTTVESAVQHGALGESQRRPAIESLPVKSQIYGVQVDGVIHVTGGLEGVVSEQIEQVPGLLGEILQLLQLLHPASLAREKVQGDRLPLLDADGLWDERHDPPEQAVRVRRDRDRLDVVILRQLDGLHVVEEDQSTLILEANLNITHDYENTLFGSYDL